MVIYHGRIRKRSPKEQIQVVREIPQNVPMTCASNLIPEKLGPIE